MCLWFLFLLLSCSFPFLCLLVCFHLFEFFSTWLQLYQTKRDSLLAGFTYPSSPMSMPRRHSWSSRSHGQPSSTAAPSDSLTPSRSDTYPTAPDVGPSILPAESGNHTFHQGYSSANIATPIPAPADHQAPILPRMTEEAYPLQMELSEMRRQLHAYYFVEVHLQLTIPNRHFAALW